MPDENLRALAQQNSVHLAMPIFGGVRQPSAPTGDGPEITVRAVAWCAGVGIMRKPPRRSAEPDTDTIGW